MGFIDVIKEKAKSDKKRIVLPESMDRRIFEAAESILKDDVADIIIIGTKEEVAANSEGLNIDGAIIIDPNTHSKTAEYIDMLEEATKLLLNEYMFYACMMVKAGDADGVVSGACHSTANTLKPALQIIKTKPGTKLVSTFFLMEVPDCDLGAGGKFVFGDCGLNQNPNPEELAAIALSKYPPSIKVDAPRAVPRMSW